MSRLHCGVPALGLISLLTPLAAQGADPSAEERRQLLQKLDELRGRIEQLQHQQATAPSAAQVDQTVARVLADADRRSQLLAAEGFTAGYTNGKFMVQSPDGNFSLSPGIQYQFRYVANYSDEAAAGGSDIDDGFEVRRLKAELAGNVFTKDLNYYFLWFVDSTGTVILDQAWLRYKFADDLAFRVGQYQDPVFREQLTSSRRQLAVDRSLTNVLITGGQELIVQGVELQYDHENWKAAINYHDGVVSQNTDWQEGAGNDFGVGGRMEYFFSGTRDQQADFTARGNKQTLLVVGGGADLTQDGDVDRLRHTFDVQWEPTDIEGLSLFAAYYGVNVGGPVDAYNYGGLIQAGYLINNDWEPFARANVAIFDDEQTVNGRSEDTFPELTVGVNRYFKGHAAKLTVDLNYLPNGSPTSQTGLGYLAGVDDQLVVRAQFQLVL